MRTIALAGISKNSGKTTLLNEIIRRNPDITWGVMSTGIDGEAMDRVFGTLKPSVHLPKGSVFCSDAETLEGHGSRVTVLQKVISGRDLWLLRAEAELETEITGPATVAEQIAMAKLLHRCGGKKVLIDGALDRKSIVLDSYINGIFLCVGASFGTTDEIITELHRLRHLTRIGSYQAKASELEKLKKSQYIMVKRRERWINTPLESLINGEDEFLNLLASKPEAVYIPSAYTSLLHAKLGKALVDFPGDIIFRHADCIKMPMVETFKFIRDAHIIALNKFKVAAIALNSWSVGTNPIDADHFRKEIRSNAYWEHWIDVKGMF